MSNGQRSSQRFCGRPGCGLAYLLHGHSPAACGNFIEFRSKEARELSTRVIDMSSLRSDTIDRARLLKISRHQKRAIGKAKTALTLGLRAQASHMPRVAQGYFNMALQALGSLGAE